MKKYFKFSIGLFYYFNGKNWYQYTILQNGFESIQCRKPKTELTEISENEFFKVLTNNK